jgi:drug/metabolite transporter (DMT)-like permease
MIPHGLAGNIAAFVAASLFGASVVATRVAVQEMPPLSLAFLRFAQGGLILFLSLLVISRNLLRIAWKDLPFLVLLGAILFAIFPLAFNMSLRFTEASRGALMLATMPLWSAWLARAAKRERLNLRQVVGILLTLGGVAAVLAERGLTWEGGGRTLIGDGLMLLTALCGAVYGVLAQRILGRYTSLTVTTYAMALGTLLLLPAALTEGLPEALARINGKLAGLVLFLGVLGGALGYFLWTFALSRLTPTRVAVYVNFNPMVATILAAALLTERLTGVFGVGFVAVLGGVLLVNLPRKVERNPCPQANRVSELAEDAMDKMSKTG